MSQSDNPIFPPHKPWLTASRLTLGCVLAAAVIGALSLSRQHPIVPPPPPAPPAWAAVGHDSERSSHSLSFPVPLPISLVWGPRPVGDLDRPPIIDGGGNIYLERHDGAILSLSPSGDTRWCATTVAISDTTCSGPPAVLGQPLINAGPSGLIANADGHLFVTAPNGQFAAFDPSTSTPLWTGNTLPAIDPVEGIASSADGAILYGVSTLATNRLTVVAVTRHGRPIGDWHRPSLLTRRLTTVSVAPDGTILTAASASTLGAPASLVALSTHGQVLWQTALAPGRPSYATVVHGSSPSRPWLAWVAVQGSRRSTVYAIDRTGHIRWSWTVHQPIAVGNGGVALSQRAAANPSRVRAYVTTPAGVYVLDLHNRHAWLLFDSVAHHTGSPGPATTDNQGTIYVATDTGYVLNLWPNGRIRWAYDTHRNAVGALAIDPNGNVIVTSRDRRGATFIESLGAHGMPLATARAVTTGTATTLNCAAPDCPVTVPATPPPVGYHIK